MALKDVNLQTWLQRQILKMQAKSVTNIGWIATVCTWQFYTVSTACSKYLVVGCNWCTVCRLLGTAQVFLKEIANGQINKKKHSLIGHVNELLMRESHTEQYSVLTLSCIDYKLFHAIFDVCFAFWQHRKERSVLYWCRLGFSSTSHVSVLSKFSLDLPCLV